MENRRVAEAFGIREDFVSGASFNKDLQKQKKDEVCNIRGERRHGNNMRVDSSGLVEAYA